MPMQEPLTKRSDKYTFMLTEIRKYTNYSFQVYGTAEKQTGIYKYLDRILMDERMTKKLDAVLRAIDSNPMNFSHEQKFKHLEKEVWEIKIGQVRVACIWDKKPDMLVAIYGFQKKTQKWPKKELNNMHNEKNAYYESKAKFLSGGKNGRLGKV
jgi:phage-related protein